jgi:hypothetical protein
MELTQEKILELLEAKTYKANDKPNSVDGPTKYYDATLRCASKGCSSPTHYKIEGIARCHSHAIIELNDLLCAR